MDGKTNGVLNVTITEPADYGVLLGRTGSGQSVYLPLDRFSLARAGREGIEFIKRVCSGYEKMLPVGETVTVVPEPYKKGDRFLRAENFAFSDQYQVAVNELNGRRKG